MNKRKNLLFSIISAGVGLGIFLALIFVRGVIFGERFIIPALVVFAGSILSIFVITLFHEFGHLIAGKIAGFKFVSITVWFFSIRRVGKNLKFSFTSFPEASGVTEMIPTSTNNLKKKFAVLSRGGIIANLILMAISVLPIVFTNFTGYLLCLVCPLFPLTVYMILDNLLPTDRGGIRNDGGVLYGLRKNDADSKVLLNILTIQAELYLGKTYSEIDERLYFDVPQLCEENPNFINISNLRYCYYIDKGDFESAKSVLHRILPLVENLPNDLYHYLLTEELYSVCTFDFNEKRADELMYELEKYLNNKNSVENVRTKFAYLTYVLKNSDNLEMFYKKGVREAKRLNVAGCTKFEIKLLDKINLDAEKLNENVEQ